MIGVYFSGTGNTKYCMEQFLSMYDPRVEMVALEEEGAVEKLAHHQQIIFAYPIYYSNLPAIVRDFIRDNSRLWKDKHIFIIATFGLFSGDGAGVAARLLKKYEAHILGGLHLKMPDCICDVKALKRSDSKNRQLVCEARAKICSAVLRFQRGKPTRDGLGIFSHIAGLFGQRLWFFGKTRHYSDKVRIDTGACIGCGHCIKLCPMKNLFLSQEQAQAGARCTLCYRCVNECPRAAITIIGKKVITQHSVEDFLSL